MPTKLFEPYKISGLELKNRFVRSATWDDTADSAGYVTDDSLALYRKLGQSGVGLIISGNAFISPIGQSDRNEYGVHSDDMIPGLTKMVQTAHLGGAKIALQVNHTGIIYDLPEDNITRFAVSSVKEMTSFPSTARPHRAMTDEEIEATSSDFAVAALRAQEAGFDAIQLHMAHGYLMSQFLSPVFNLRTDQWGGSIENRMKFHLDVIRRVRLAVGPDFPIMIKFGVQDSLEGGLSLSEGMAVARQMVQQGIAAIEVSMGMSTFSEIIRVAKRNEPETAYLRKLATAVKQVVTVSVMVVGGIRSLEMARSIVDSGDADLISMCRPFIREPDIIARWQRGEEGPANCISCNKCISMPSKSNSVLCWEEYRKTKRK
jgi:2,4-dienoyl-CoA reductase-like NADH-dependent reductase (Old Yellow Enzyme family)